MNPEKMLRLLEWAQGKLAEGQSMMSVNQNIMRISGGEINGFMSLQLAIPTSVRRGSMDDTVRADASEQHNDEVLQTFGTASPVQHFAEGMVQGATMGWADDLARLVGNEEFGERLAARRELNPGASIASELPGLLLPGAAAGKAMQAATKGVGFLAGAGRAAGVAALEGGVIGAGEAEGGLGERAKGAALGATISAPFGAVGPVAGRLARPFRSNKALAGIETREMLEQTGRKAEDIFDEMRLRAQMRVNQGVATAADVDPSLAARMPGIVRNAPGLRRAGGPLESLRARVSPEAFNDVRRGVFQAFDGHVVDDPSVLKFLRRNPEARAAARQVIKGNIDTVDEIRFEQLQDIRNVLRRQGDRLNTGGIRTQADNAFNARNHLTQQMERIVPGYQEANMVWSEALSMNKNATKLIEAIDKALPSFSPELPSKMEGSVLVATREILSNSKTRKSMIAQMVGEAFLEEGEAGITRLQGLVKRGWFSKLFRGLKGAPAGAAVAVPGLLATRSENF
jgi:hypothetical protein